MPVTDVSNMKVADLKRELKLRGHSITGNKNELLERLQAAMEGEPLLDDTALVGEDILDEDGVLSDEEKILASDENELLQSPNTTPTTSLSNILNNSKNIATIDDILESPTTNKKIVLKRKNSLNVSSALESNTNTTKENTEHSPDKTVKICERNRITMESEKKDDENGVPATKKLKELTMQERLELRAKKFGIEGKIAIPAMTAKEKSSSISIAPAISNEKQVELLKKRAERFGCVTSTNLAKLDAEERLIKRKQRFGGRADDTEKSVVSSTLNSSNSDEWAEKARKRLERFKAKSTHAVLATDTPATVIAAASST